MTIEEYRNKLVQAQGGKSSSASSGLSGYREALAQTSRETGLVKIYDEINQGYSGIQSGLQLGDVNATRSALARVRRNIEALRHYGGLLKDERLLQDAQSAQESYQSAWLKYDALKRQRATESSPMASALKTYDGTGGKLGQNAGNIDFNRSLLEEKADYYDRWGHYTEEGDFDVWAARGAAIENPSLQKAENAGTLFGKRIGGADIGNIVTYSRDNWEQIAMGEANGSTMQGRSIYHYMRDDEVNLYNYLLAKEGRETAQTYLDELEESLNYRMGSGQASRFTGIDNGAARAAALGLYGLTAGLDQWNSGVKQAVQKEQLPTTAVQYGSERITNGLSGFGKTAYQTATTIGNMAPSILVSAVLGAAGVPAKVAQAAGSAVVGASAAGNAYNQALKDGYTQEQSRAYSSMVGIAEAGLQYLLGGIDKLGGISGKLASRIANIDNALLRVAAKYGASIGSEILEEELQNFLDPAFRTIVFDEEYDAPTIEELIETAVVTALSTGLLESVDIVGGEIQTGQRDRAVGKYILLNGYTDGLMQSAAEMGLDTTGKQTPAALGSLYLELQDKYLEQAIQERIMTLGEVPSRTLGAAVLRNARGEMITVAQRKALNGSAAAKQITGEVREALKGNASETNRWFSDAYIRPMDLEKEESVTETPESVTEPGENITERPTSAPEALVSEMETASENDLTAGKEAETLLAALDGMTEAEATVYLSEKSAEYAQKEQEALRTGDTTGADAYYTLGKALTDAALNSAGSSVLMVDLAKRNLGGIFNAEGTDVSDGAGRRNAGAGAGVEVGGMESRQDGGNTGGEGIRGEDGRPADRTIWESARDLGIPRGTDEKIIRRTPLAAWTAEMRELAREAAGMGYDLQYVNGSISVTNPVSGQTQRVTGVIYGGSIVVQADHRLYSAEQLARHEIMHAKLTDDPAMREDIVSAIVSRFDRQEIQNITARYANGYGFIYGVETESMTADELMALDMQYLEEFICDAYAGINRAFMGSGSTAARYGEIVTDIAESRIGMGNGSGGMPGARYSLEPYTEQQVKNWSGSKKIVIYKNDQQVLDFVSRALTDKGYVGKMYFGIVSDELAEHIFNETGVEVSGRNVVLRANNIRKVQKKHGDEYKEGLQGQRAVTASDYVKIPEIISEADKMARSDYREASGDIRPGVLFEKNYADGKVTVFAVDSGGSLELFVQTMYAQKNKESIANLIDEYSPIRTPKASVGTAPNASISESSENSNPESRFSMDDAGKAPEEMTAAELRRAIKGDQSMLEAYARIERASGLTPEVRNERDAVASRLVKERELLKEKNEQFAAEKQDARERARARTVPTRAKADFRKEMLDIFSTQSGMRQELGTLVDRFAEDTLSRGAISYQDRARLIDRLYEAGVMTVEADAYSQDIRGDIAGTRVYVDEGTRHEFGDSESWAAFRREAFGAGVYLTAEKKDNHIDGMYQELAGMYPGSFRHASGDMKGMLEEIVAMAREGKAEHISLAEMMHRVEKDTGWSVDEQMDAMERKVDTAIDKFVEKAKLETDLKARSAVQQGREREQRRAIMERQAESRNMREMQQKTMKSLQWLKKNERRMPEGMKEQAQELLDGLDLYAISIANEMRWSGKHQATWKDLAEMYQNARENDPNFLPSKELEMIWSRVNLKKVGELDPDALETLYRAASALRTEFYNRNNVINDEEHRLFSEAYRDSVSEIRDSGGKGMLGTVFNAEQLTPVNVLQMMGGWRRNGEFFSFARMLESGERDYKGYVVGANRVLQEFIEENQDWVKKADGQGKDAIWYEVEVPELLELHMGDKPIFGDTVKVYMTPAQKVHLYLESMNYQNLRHMAGGRTFVNRELYEKGERTEALAQGTTIKLAPETVKRLVSDLTEEEMALAKVLQTYYNAFASERINKVSNPLYGFDKAVTRDYAPIFSNRNYTKTEPGVFDMTAEGVGHMKGREQFSKNPSYNISAFDAFERHVEQTARFVGYAIPVRNMNTLMNWRVQGSSMRDEITHVWGEEGAKYIEDYVKKLQSPVFQEKDTIQKATGKLLSNYITGVFGANPSVVLKQVLSYPMAGSVLGFGNMPNPAQIARTDSELIARYTPELEYRRMGYATPEVSQLKDNPNWTQTDKVTKFVFGGGAITWTDAAAARALWPWAENYVRKNFPELETGTQEQINAGQSPFYRKVAEIYNDAVTNTQSMSDISHRPKIMNSDSAVTKAFTMFKSDSAQAYNTIRRLGGELARATKDGDKVKARKARTGLAAGTTAILLSQIGGEAIDFLMALWKNKAKWYRDDEDELTGESVAREYMSGLAESLAGIMIGGEELMQVILALINHEDWSFQNGIEVPGMEQLNDFIDATLEAAAGMGEFINGAVDILKNDGDLGQYLKKNTGNVLGIIKDTAVTMAQYLGGAPAANIEKYLLGTVKWILPEWGAAYDNFFSTPTKDSLSGMKGGELAATVGDILAIRDIQADDGTSAELARLYEAGERGAVPGTIPESFSVNGEDFTLNAAQIQEYESAYAKALGGNLNLLVESDVYIEADDETRAKMLDRLYTYATQTAKRAVAPEYEGDTWTRNAAAAEEEGVPVSAYAALQAQGLSKTADKIAYIDDLRMTDDQKGVLYYHAVASDARKEDADALMDAGMSWGTMYETMREYMDIEATDGMTASQKAATFKTWAYNNLSSAQTETAIEHLSFSTGMKASTSTYDKLMDSGLTADEALALSTAWSDLEPEDGRTTVSDLQKMNAIIKTEKSPETQMKALSSMLDESNRWKLARAANYGVTAEDYVDFKNTLEDYYDYDPNGSVGALSQNEVTAAIRSMSWLSTNAKAVLWQIQTMGKDGKNNPFSTSIGGDVYSAYQEWKESGEEAVTVEEDDLPVQPKGWIGNYEGLQLPVW